MPEQSAVKIQVIGAMDSKIYFTGEAACFITVGDLKLAVEKASQVPAQQQQLLLGDMVLSAQQELAEALRANNANTAVTLSLVKLPKLPFVVVARIGSIFCNGVMGAWCARFGEERRLFLESIGPEATLKELVLHIAKKLASTADDVQALQIPPEVAQELQQTAAAQDESVLVKNIRLLVSSSDTHNATSTFGSCAGIPWKDFKLVPLSELEKRTAADLEEAEESTGDINTLMKAAKAVGGTETEILEALRGGQAEEALIKIITRLSPENVEMRKVNVVFSSDAPEEFSGCAIQ